MEAECAEFPPDIFAISTSVETQNVTVSIAVEKCQLCGGSRRSFYCKACIIKGDVKKSTKVVSRGPSGSESNNGVAQLWHLTSDDESYKEKLVKWQKLLEDHKKLKERCTLTAGKKLLRDQKSTDLLLMKQNTDLLKKAITQKQLLLNKEKTDLEKLRDENIKRIKKQRERRNATYYTERLSKKKKHIITETEKIESYDKQLKECKKQHIQELVHFIFPISEVQPQSNDYTVDLLAEARLTSYDYVKGHWVYLEASNELQYSIVHPSLSGSGDYSTYNLWARTCKDDSASPESKRPHLIKQNPAYNIGAALRYTAQMVTSLSYFLDVNLPYKVLYSNFGEDLNEESFQSLVFKLNSNILHLLSTQNVPVQDLNPEHTLENILILMKTPSLGRIGPFRVSDELMRPFEESCPPGMTESDFSDQPDGECTNDEGEWEQVSAMLPEAEMPAPASFYSSIQSTDQSSDTLTSQSITGGLMSSASAAMSSLWRGWGTKSPTFK